MAVHNLWGDDVVVRPRSAPPPPLMDALAALTAPDRGLDIRVERALNTSSIHDDHLDRFPDDAGAFTSNASAVDRWLMSNFSTARGGLFTSMVLDEAADVWTVSGRGADGSPVEARHRLLAVAKTMAALRMAGH